MIKSKFLRKLANLPENETPETKVEFLKRYFKNVNYKRKK